jgi:integrase
MFSAAEAAGIIVTNPFKAPGRGAVTRAHQVQLPTLTQVHAITEALPPRLRVAAILGFWGGLRSGELRELRRGDLRIVTAPDANGTPIDVVVTEIARGVTELHQGRGIEFVAGPPKTRAGTRTVVLPPEYADAVTTHLAEHVGAGDDALIVTSGDGISQLGAEGFHRYWRKAVAAAGLPGFRYHDCRHYLVSHLPGAGASPALRRALSGHASEGISALYQHELPGEALQVASRLVTAARDADTPHLRIVEGGAA